MGLLDKRSDFADHLLFIKLAKAHGISIIGANVLRGIPGETPDDVLDSTQRLAYLRFALCRRESQASVRQ